MPIPAEIEWRTRWERLRRKGQRHFIVSFFVLNGLLPGVFAGGLLLFVHPRIGSQDLGSPIWVIVILIAFCAWGMFQARRWWRVSEQKFHEVATRDGS